MHGSVNSWRKVWLVMLMVGFVALVQVTQAQAWGIYFGAHGGRSTVTMEDTDANFGGTSPARKLIFNHNLNDSISSWDFAYIKYITGFESDGFTPHPWAGGPEARNNLDTALIKFKLRNDMSELPTGGLSVSLYHISDDSWKRDEITFANSPHFNDPLTATLLDTQIVTGTGFVTWNLLNNDRYRPLWQSQDFYDYTISVMLKVDEIPDNLGKAVFLEEGTSLTLEGQTSPVPLPGAVFLFGSGLMGLGLRAARRRVKNF